MLRVPSQYVTSFRSVHSLSWVLVVSHFHKVCLDYQTGSLCPAWPMTRPDENIALNINSVQAAYHISPNSTPSIGLFVLKTTPLWQQYTSIKLSLFKWNSLLSFSDGILSKLTQCSLTHSQAAFRSSKPVELTIAGWLWIFLPRFFFSNLRRFLLSAECPLSFAQQCNCQPSQSANHGDDDQEYNDDDRYFSEFFGEQRKFVMIS